MTHYYLLDLTIRTLACHLLQRRKTLIRTHFTSGCSSLVPLHSQRHYMITKLCYSANETISIHDKYNLKEIRDGFLIKKSKVVKMGAMDFSRHSLPRYWEKP